MTDTRDERNPFLRPLPGNPDLEKQKKLAKTLMRDYCAGETEAVGCVEALHPKPPAADSFKLSDAQLVIARTYGYSSWPKLKHKIDALTKTPLDLFIDAVRRGDTEAVRALTAQHPDLRGEINSPHFDFGRPAPHAARDNLDLLDLLLSHGGDINARSQWEHGGFGILDDIEPGKADALIARGAEIDIWAAAHLGRVDTLQALLDADPSLADAKGGDGKRPLHFAGTPETAELLLARGAEIDALDDDHDSTPAQHLIGDRPEVSAFLVGRGAKSDLLLAVALGDADLVRKHLADDPGSIRMRVNQDWFPMIDTAENGGHIYQWSLGFYLSAFQIARNLGHGHIIDVLNRHAGPLERMIDALWSGDLPAADEVVAEHPDILAGAGDDTLRLVSDAGRYNDTGAVREMLARGFPVTARGQHGAMPLHWAAFHGNPDMLQVVLAHEPPLEAIDNDFGGTAMGWALHGTFGSWPGTSTGRHAECMEILLALGVPCPDGAFPVGHDEVDGVLRRHLFGSD